MGNMKLKFLFAFVYLLMGTAVFAENEPPVESRLSLTNMWRIERAAKICEQSDNDLLYAYFWGDSIKPENRETVCLSEQFVLQLVSEGDNWLENKSEKLVEECKKQGKKDKGIYTLCLEKNLEQKALILSKPCKEIGEKKIWSEQSCKLLVSYIFRMKFDKILEPKIFSLEYFKRSLDRLSENKWLILLINPVMAVLVFLLCVLDVVFLSEKGNWMQITRTGFIVGPLMLLSVFTKAGNRLLSSGLVMIIIIGFIAWNHHKIIKKPKKKKPIPIEF